MIGGQLVAILQKMEDDLAAVDVAPIIPAKQLGSAIVLALDEILPENLVLTPKATAMFGIVALSTQRWWHREAIAVARQGEAYAVAAAKPANPSPPPPTSPPPSPSPSQSSATESDPQPQQPTNHVRMERMEYDDDDTTRPIV
jgi:hypothetical protein